MISTQTTSLEIVKFCIYYRVSIKVVIQEAAVGKVVGKRGYYRVQCRYS